MGSKCAVPPRPVGSHSAARLNAPRSALCERPEAVAKGREVSHAAACLSIWHVRRCTALVLTLEANCAVSCERKSVAYVTL